MISVTQAGFSYPHSPSVLKGVSFELYAGERTVLLGANGSGKTTLARLINGSLLPAEGEVCVDGTYTSGVSSTDGSPCVGLLRQDPGNQLISASVFEEVAFGPLNLGLSQAEVRERVNRSLELCGISHLQTRATHELSGGQQQLLALAATLALSPKYLVLDEAYAQLDARTRTKIRSLIDTLVASGMGVLELSHSVESLFGASRVLWLHNGQIAWNGSPNELLQDASLAVKTGLMHTEIACVLQKAAASGFDLSAPCDMTALASHLRKKGLENEVGRLLLCAGYPEKSPVSDVCSNIRLDVHPDGCPNTRSDVHKLSLSKVSVTFGETQALTRMSLKSEGELVLVAGRSGSGKTTAARVLAGVLEPLEGSALFDGTLVRAGFVGLAFQNPENQVFEDTVFNDIAYGPRARGLAGTLLEECVGQAVELVDIPSELLDRSPFELSGGQLRRVALAGLVACHFDALVLDEPTAGLDGPSRRLIRNMARACADRGASVVVITHDVGEWLALCDRVVLMADGKVAGTYQAHQAQLQESIYESADLEAPLSVQLLSRLMGGEDLA